jgi:hypothetical protein|tara:strand:+ start:267 stop:560 length:294 start_codon:yes stop_codon:yes gene_type:complete
MSNENVKTMVDSLASGDNVAAQDAFKSALTDKIGQALDDKRQTVANDWLNSAQDLEANKDASELDNLGASPEGTVGGEDSESLEIDQDEKEDEQPTV